MKVSAILVVALSIVISAGVVHGVKTRRWGASINLEEAIAPLHRIPLAIGDWEGEADLTIPDAQLQIGEIDGYLSRNYRNREDGSIVSLLIVCGRPGPISVHTPDVCFRGQGLRASTAPEVTEVPPTGDSQSGHRFLSADFYKASPPSAVGLRVFWGWTPKTTWDAPVSPRIEYAHEPFLYKMYLSRPVTYASAGGEPEQEDEPVQRFLKDFLPAFEQAMTTADSAAATAK